MPLRRVKLHEQNVAADATKAGPKQSTPLTQRFAAIRAKAQVSEVFSPEVEAAASAAVNLPMTDLVDFTHLEFVTIDPEGATDLDQALMLEKTDTGFRVWYAIADVPHFVTLGDPIDVEATRRGSTVYCPDLRVPLHPPVLSEGVASLLPGQTRPAFVWCIDLDSTGEPTKVDLKRGLVTSREQLSYHQAQADLDAGTASEMLKLLPIVGTLRADVEIKRGGASLNVPEAEVHPNDQGGYDITLRTTLPCENYNAQISLLTGMCAARIMLDGGVGILRTMPPADQEAVQRFRAVVAAHERPWPAEQTYGDYLRTLDPDNHLDLALLHQATALFRGAGYQVIDGKPTDESVFVQSAIASPYAHTTAPLRRLVDRFSLVVCEALVNKHEISAEFKARLPELPAVMAGTTRVANQVDRDCLDAVEAALMVGHIGETFKGVVVSIGENKAEAGHQAPASQTVQNQAPTSQVAGTLTAEQAATNPAQPTASSLRRVKVQILEPPVLASITEADNLNSLNSLELGAFISVQITIAEIERGKVELKFIAQ